MPKSFAALGICAALACAKAAPRPGSIRASATAHGIEVSWEGLEARAYRVQLADLESGAAVGAPAVVRGTRAALPGTYARALGVWVDPLPAGERGYGFVSAGAGDGSRWQMFGAQEFHGGELRTGFAQLDAGERLGVLLINAGGSDAAAADVEVSGAAVDAAAPVAQRTALFAAPLAAPSLALHAPEFAVTGTPAAPEPMPARRSFCVVPGLDFSTHLRAPATLAASTAHAEFYLDDQDLSHYDAAFIPAVADAFEARVWPAVTSAFGAPTDVDANGKLLVVFSHQLGAHLQGGWLIGYFGNADLLQARDDSPGCSDGGSNHGEIVYLNDLQNGAANGWSAADLSGTVYPETLAHEIQHLLNLGHRCVQRSCDGPEQTWINEALSKVSEDLAGYGWNAAEGRAMGTSYLGRGGDSLRGYDGRSLTRWEGDPIGNYQGAHSFLRLFTDRSGPSLAGAIAAGEGGIAGLEAALQRPLPRAMAEWASALLLSNESGSPYSFSGASWSPLHERLRHLDTRAPGPLTLRSDGIAAVLSGVGLGGPAEVVVRSNAEVPPNVVVLRVPATLPAR